jgi:hypothetical protein
VRVRFVFKHTKCRGWGREKGRGQGKEDYRNAGEVLGEGQGGRRERKRTRRTYGRVDSSEKVRDITGSRKAEK